MYDKITIIIGAYERLFQGSLFLITSYFHGTMVKGHIFLIAIISRNMVIKVQEVA